MYEYNNISARIAYNWRSEILTDKFTGIRDFIILHYKATQRTDSSFWNHCRLMDIPDSVRNKIELYQANVIGILMLVGYWLLPWLYGGADAYSIEGNLVTHLDRQLLGDNHLWKGKGVPFDPEGLLSTLPAVVNVLIGFEIARFISSRQNKTQTAVLLSVAGVVAILIGLLWSLVMPINKSL